MAATVIINRLTGAGPSLTAITTINTRCNAEDAHSVAGTTNPITVPTSGTNYSYWCVTRLQCTVAPTTLINNLKWYTDGTNSFGTGVTLSVGTATGYTQASGTAGTTGIVLSAGNYATWTLGNANAFTYTSASPLSVTGSTSTAVEFGDRVVFQFNIATTAAPGATPQENLNWRWDES